MGSGCGVACRSCHATPGWDASAMPFLSVAGLKEGLHLRASPLGCNPQVADALLDPLRQNLPTPTTSAAPSAAAT